MVGHLSDFQSVKRGSDYKFLNVRAFGEDLTIFRRKSDFRNADLVCVQRYCPHASGDFSEGRLKDYRKKVPHTN